MHASVISSTMPRTHRFWASLSTGNATAAVDQHEYALTNRSGRRTAQTSGKPLGSSKFSQQRRGEPDPNESSTHNHPFGRQFVPPTESRLTTHIYAGHGGSKAHEDAPMSSQIDEDTSQSSLKERGEYGVWAHSELTQEVEYQDQDPENYSRR